jgi:hypothetical protein
MNANYRKLLTVSVVAGLVALAVEMASAQSWLDASSKMRGNFGQAGASSSVGGGTVYRAPVTASAPAATRSFSYEPPAATPAPAASTAKKAPTTDTVKKVPDTAKKVETAKKAPATTRSFSYEPSYSAPAARPVTPLFLVPKSLR